MSRPVKAASAAAAPAEAAPAAPAKNKKALIIIIALLVLIIAGGAGWNFTQSHATSAEHAKEVKAVPVLQPKYVPLGEKFTVNLQQEEGDRYLQVGITLKVLDAKLEDEIKTAMPEVRSKLLLLLSSKKPSELASVAGKQVLVQQVIAEIDGILGIAPAPASEGHDTEHAAAPVAAKTTGITDVLFTDFIIQ
ncbi:MAG: flagellar basal body-associated FliL family protein [Sideroxyarcus sp.]|nr:flagellar basal body-associated FliL family protein [Sideroxyarcus sp.]